MGFFEPSPTWLNAGFLLAFLILGFTRLFIRGDLVGLVKPFSEVNKPAPVGAEGIEVVGRGAPAQGA
jgi:hypothetical protein